jgi:hypothetical protein
MRKRSSVSRLHHHPVSTHVDLIDTVKDGQRKEAAIQRYLTPASASPQ